MSKFVQFSGLIGVSAALHVAAFWGAGQDGGAPSGAGGANSVTLAAAPAALAQAVAQWDRSAPAAAQVAVPETPVPPTDQTPSLTAPETPDTPRAVAPLPTAPAQIAALPIPAAPVAPRAPETAAAPPPQPAPEVPRVRPTRRPEPPTPQPVRSADLAPPTPAPAPAPAAAPPARPATKPAPAPSAPLPETRAAGAGGGAQAGAAREATGDAPSAARINKLMARWGGGIRKRVLRRQRYPSGTRAEATVRVALWVSAEGHLVEVKVTRSSGDGALDQAALRAVRSASLPRAPKGLTGTHRFDLGLEFTR